MKKNLIFISLDTVRADVAYTKGFPGINELRKHGVTFLNTISSSPLTPISHATVFTGVQPPRHGIRHLFKEKVKKNIPTLTQLLKKKGYQTKAIVSCPGMNSWYGFSKGFSDYDDEIPLLADGSDPLKTVDVKKRGTALKRADIVYERASEWLENKSSKDPFFLFLHFFDAHWPYEAPAHFGGKNAYEEEVAYSDHYMHLFIKKLKKMNLYDSSIIVCFSDHGEDLHGLYPNDKGGKKLGHPEEFGHGCLLYDQTQKVVCIIKDVKRKKSYKKSISAQVRLVDLMPTTLEMMGLTSSISLDGVSLVPYMKGKTKEDLVAYSETYYPEEQTQATKGKFSHARNKKSIRIKNKEKVIVNLESELVETYDLLKDPNEMNNLTAFAKGSKNHNG